MRKASYLISVFWAAAAIVAPAPARMNERLARLLPEPAGKADVPRFYGQDLYLYIDGGAQAFHNYDMVAMVHRRYEVRGMELTVDIYDMGDALNAFGVYSAERSPDQRFLSIGDEANLTDSTLNFFQDAFYVKLSAFAGDQKPGPVMESFAKDIERRIGARGGLPNFFATFPPGHLIPHSQRYIKRAALGHEFLRSTYMASYSIEGRQTVLAVADAGAAGPANEWLERLKAHFAASGKAETWPAMPGGICASNPLEGDWRFLARGQYVVIMTNPPAQPEALLRDLLRKLSP